MRRRCTLVAALAVVVVAAAAEACRAPTQAKVLVTTTSECSELGDVALVASGSQEASEDRAARGYFAAQTQQCDGDKTIGSLFVTPGGARAALIVLAAPKGRAISSCVPPGYRGCIVARRAFSFIDNLTLSIPVSLEVECRDVPCDSFTTCRKGVCLSSEITCASGGDCRLQGELPDGGIAPDAEVFVDGSTNRDASNDGASNDGASNDGASNDGASNDGAKDSGSDAGVDAGAPPPAGVTCAGATLTCDAAGKCLVPNGCCENVMVADSLSCVPPASFPCTGGLMKGRRRYCCDDTACQSYVDTPHCNAVGGNAGTCTP